MTPSFVQVQNVEHPQWTPWPGHEWRSWPTHTKALTDVRMEGLASAQTQGGMRTEALFITSAKEGSMKKAPACIVMACRVVGEERAGSRGSWQQ